MSDPAEEPVLSSEETNALLDAMKSSALNKEPIEYDLIDADGSLNENLALIEKKKKKLASSIRNTILGRLGTTLDVTVESIRVCPTTTASEDISSRMSYGFLRLDDEFGGVIAVSSKFVSFAIDKRMGAPELEPSDRDQLSEVDKRIVRPVFNQLLEAVLSQFPAEGTQINLVEIEDTLDNGPKLTNAESYLSLVFQLRGAKIDEVTLHILLTKDCARALFPKAKKKAENVHNSSRDRQRIASGLKAIEVQVTALLGNVPSSVRQVLTLSPGDVLQTDRSVTQEVDFFLGSKRIWRGTPGTRNGNLAVTISRIM